MPKSPCWAFFVPTTTATTMTDGLTKRLLNPLCMHSQGNNCDGQQCSVLFWYDAASGPPPPPGKESGKLCSVHEKKNTFDVHFLIYMYYGPFVRLDYILDEIGN